MIKDSLVQLLLATAHGRTASTALNDRLLQYQLLVLQGKEGLWQRLLHPTPFLALDEGKQGQILTQCAAFYASLLPPTTSTGRESVAKRQISNVWLCFHCVS